MKNPTYYNGIICPLKNASIPLSDRSFFFADAVYDVMIGRNKKPYQFTEHMQRLRKNSEKIGLQISQTDDEILEIISELILLSSQCEFMLYVHVSGNSDLRIHKRNGALSNLFIMLSDISIPTAPGSVSAILLHDDRYNYCNIKTTNLLPSVLSLETAEEQNADTAIFHIRNTITEASSSNVFIVKGNKLITPENGKHLLPGITRNNVINLTRKLGIECIQQGVKKDSLFDADAVFLSSTTKFVQICKRIGGIDMPNAKNCIVEKIFDGLHTDFLQLTE